MNDVVNRATLTERAITALKTRTTEQVIRMMANLIPLARLQKFVEFQERGGVG